jgi:heme/copper-type cytochrome/quinol oxidase subunit 3
MAHQATASHLTDVSHGAHEGAHGAEGGTENVKFAMWLFLGSEVMFFTVLIAGYVYARFMAPAQHGILNVPLTSLNTFLLLASSFTVVRALAAIQIDDRTKFLRSLALTIILGAIFLGVQVYEYDKLGHEGLTLSGSAPSAETSTTVAATEHEGQGLTPEQVQHNRIFGMAFFTLTGFHGFHVLIGVIWALRVFWNAFNGKYTQKDHFGVEFFGLYWHFVDVVWILIFTIVYLI